MAEIFIQVISQNVASNINMYEMNDFIHHPYGGVSGILNGNM